MGKEHAQTDPLWHPIDVEENVFEGLKTGPSCSCDELTPRWKSTISTHSRSCRPQLCARSIECEQPPVVFHNGEPSVELRRGRDSALLLL